MVHVVERAYQIINHRLPHCPLVALARHQFGPDTPEAEQAQHRAEVFLLWCVQRTIDAYGRQRGRHAQLAEASARSFRHFLDVRADGNSTRARELVAEANTAFRPFDAAMARTDRPGPAHWLGRAAVAYVTDNQFNPRGPNDMMTFTFPAEVMRGIDKEVTALLRSHGA